MYRVMIVDDEHFIREGIKNCIQWEDHKITDVVTASGGKEALDRMRVFKPHIVLCDIMMGDMDGFEVLKRINELDGTCKVIFLTGHDDFKFAQRAVRLGAFDYLLKISSAQEIVEVIQKAIKEIEEEAKQQKNYEKLKQDAEAYSPLIRNKIMNMFVMGEDFSEANHEEGQIYSDLKNTLEISYFMIAVFRTNILRSRKYKNQREAMTANVREAISKWANDKFGEHVMMFQNMAGDFVVISAFPDVEDRDLLEDMFVQACNLLKGKLAHDFDVGLSVGIGNPHKAYTNINSGYDQAIEALDYYSLDHKSCVRYRDVDGCDKVNPVITVAEEKVLMSAFKSFETEEMNKVLGKVYQQFEGALVVERRTVIDFTLVLYGMLRKVIQELKVDVSSLFMEQSFYNQILQISEYDGVKRSIHQLFINASEIVSQKHVRGITDNVQFACEYIESHFDEDITLEKLAGMIHLSPSHFSNMFSKETGMSFLQYLTSCRIEQAKIMLMDKNYKTYEVGESVGYANPHYFSRIFKKHTGIPPTQYRDKMLKTNKIIKREK